MTLTLQAIEDALRAHQPASQPDHTCARAAVLVPLIVLGGAVHVVLTERSSDLSLHAGQIAFPGGRQDEYDPSLQMTALREANEEIGLADGDVRFISTLSEHLTRTSHHHITPFVAEITLAPYPWRLNSAEVTRLFEIPLAHLAKPSNQGKHEYHPDGELCEARTSPAFFWEGHTIWGATADILTEFLSVIDS
jgi:8-oxo-dGTP pyrophosphatase MutT (NUDIX family)